MINNPDPRYDGPTARTTLPEPSPPPPRGQQPREQAKELTGIAAGGSAMEIIAGAGGAVLAILGLAGVLPYYMAPVATIAIGAGMFLESGSLGAATYMLDGETREPGVVPGSLTLQGAGGAAGIVLGILALVGVLGPVLVSVGVLLLGAGMAFGGPGRAELHLTELEIGHASQHARRLASQALQASAGVLTLAGVGAVTLAIIAIAGAPAWAALDLVGLLALGGAQTLAGSALAGRLGVGAHPFKRG